MAQTIPQGFRGQCMMKPLILLGSQTLYGNQSL